MRSNMSHPISVHAEVDCCMKIKKTNKKTKVNMIVIRTNWKGEKLMMSKPCKNCVRTSMYLLEKKGYKLKNIYYSDIDGNIVKL